MPGHTLFFRPETFIKVKGVPFDQVKIVKCLGAEKSGPIWPFLSSSLVQEIKITKEGTLWRREKFRKKSIKMPKKKQ